MSDDLYTLKSGAQINNPEMSAIMERLMSLQPHCSMYYTWDDIGTATLMSDIYNDSIRFCPQNGLWYIWDKCWRKQGESGEISDRLQTLLNLLLLYCKEFDDEETGEYAKYIKSIRKYNSMKNIMDMLKTMVRMQIKEMNINPYIINTPHAAFDLKTGQKVTNVRDYNVTKLTSCSLPDCLTSRCDRWYQFIDEIMSCDGEKASFLQRALGYSILGVNREECMFLAYGSTTRNGKGTLFSTIASVLGEDYADSAPVDLICEGRNGRSTDFNAAQPALSKLVGTRLVTMSESAKDARLDAASIKTITGRDTLVTRDLYESSFSFVPQFTMWLNTNHLPAVTDDTVFTSNRIWVIEFNRHFEENEQDKDLKELFLRDENRPTILKWLVDGCHDYIKYGLNVPEVVRDATAQYRKMHDRIGCFIDECCEIDPEESLLRGDLYKAYNTWCNRMENRYKALGSTTFYNEISSRGYSIRHKMDGTYVFGLKLKDGTESGHIKLT